MEAIGFRAWICEPARLVVDGADRLAARTVGHENPGAASTPILRALATVATGGA